jgi:hypothetical protein
MTYVVPSTTASLCSCCSFGIPPEVALGACYLAAKGSVILMQVPCGPV